MTLAFHQAGQLLGRLTVATGRQPVLEGDLDWLDLHFEPYSEAAGREVSLQENPEQWALALVDAYRDSTVFVEVLGSAPAAAMPAKDPLRALRTPRGAVFALCVMPLVMCAVASILAFVFAGLFGFWAAGFAGPVVAFAWGARDVWALTRRRDYTRKSVAAAVLLTSAVWFLVALVG